MLSTAGAVAHMQSYTHTHVHMTHHSPSKHTHTHEQPPRTGGFLPLRHINTQHTHTHPVSQTHTSLHPPIITATHTHTQTTNHAHQTPARDVCSPICPLELPLPPLETTHVSVSLEPPMTVKAQRFIAAHLEPPSNSQHTTTLPAHNPSTLHCKQQQQSCMRCVSASDSCNALCLANVHSSMLPQHIYHLQQSSCNPNTMPAQPCSPTPCQHSHAGQHTLCSQEPQHAPHCAAG